jgi:hypothetical protein
MVRALRPIDGATANGGVAEEGGSIAFFGVGLGG